MTSNLLIFVFFVLFLLFLIESVYFLKKKLSMGPIQSINQEEDQNRGKWILIGGLILVVILMGSFGFFFLSKQQGSPSNIALKTTPTVVPTQPLPTPTPNETVYNFPTTTAILPSPTLVLITTVAPTKALVPTKTLTPTLKPTMPISTLTPTKIPPIGGPALISPTVVQSTSSAIVVPKPPIAGSMEQTLVIFFAGIASVVAGLIL